MHHPPDTQPQPMHYTLSPLDGAVAVDGDSKRVSSLRCGECHVNNAPRTQQLAAFHQLIGLHFFLNSIHLSYTMTGIFYSVTRAYSALCGQAEECLVDLGSDARRGCKKRG